MIIVKAVGWAAEAKGRKENLEHGLVKVGLMHERLLLAYIHRGHREIVGIVFGL